MLINGGKITSLLLATVLATQPMMTLLQGHTPHSSYTPRSILQSCFQVSWPQPVLVQWVILVQLQESALTFAEPHKHLSAHLSSLSRALWIEALLSRLLTACPQTHWECTLSPCAINKDIKQHWLQHQSLRYTTSDWLTVIPGHGSLTI